MSGVEFVVGGWFASAAIRKFVDKAGVYLGDSHGLHKKTKKMLNNLKNRLPEMQAILEEAEKQHMTNEGIIEWLKLVKDAAYEAEDVLDDFEAKRIKRIHEELINKGKVRKAASSIAKGAKNLLLTDDDARKLMGAVNNLEQLCNQCRTFFWSLKLDLYRKGKGLICTEGGKISPILQHDQPMFGRDSEIKAILNIILGYEIESFECEMISQEMDPDIESLEHETNCEGIGDEIESLRHTAHLENHKRISEDEENLVRSSKKSEKGIGFHKIGQNMFGIMRQKLLRWLGKIEGDEAVEFIQESLTDTGAGSSLYHGIGEEPLSGQISFDKAKATSSIDAGVTSGLKNIEPSSSKAQKLLLETNLKQRTGNYGRPFVIPIVGISGIGKTALAQTIYSHPRLKDHFFLKKWFYISHESDVNEMVKAFIPFFDPNDPCDLKEKFVKEITGKRFLLVLDDVSGKVCSMVENMLNWCSSAAFRSVILVTTQEWHVAEKLGTINPIILDPLEWNYFFQLLLHYAFLNFNMTNEQREALKTTCKVIGRPLPRLPLVAKTVGNLLRSDIDQDRWELVSRIPWKSLYNGCIISILENCYRDLNPKLKQCFVLCSISPPNYIIEKERIIQMWIANNFIQTDSSEDSRLEDFGGMQFDELVNRSFFIPTPWPDPCFHGYSIIHNGPSKVPDTTRHLTLIKNDLDFVPGTCWYNKLRTLLFYGHYSGPSGSYSSSMLAETRKLRVLKLSYPGEGVERHMNSMGELSHLRFLDLSFTGITELPESLCSLCHLQVLDIIGCKFKRLPKNMSHLINLRHLYASYQTISLVSDIGKLTLLQELEQFWVSDLEGNKISELAEMNEIGGHLSITNLWYVKYEDEAQKARLKDKKHLKVLSLRWNRNRNRNRYYDKSNDFKVLNSLQPHSALEMLEIVDYLDTILPSWTTLALVNIRCIYLKGCNHIKNLPHFGKLRHLDTILFDGLTIEKIGEELYGPDEVIFPALKVLKFVAMKIWKVWSPATERELLPRLEELEIWDCDSLRETPFHSLKLSCLKKLELSCCSGALLEGSICVKPLPMLSSLYMSGNQRSTIVLSYPNFPNLRILSLGKDECTVQKESAISNKSEESNS